jgi:hypothetical protein
MGVVAELKSDNRLGGVRGKPFIDIITGIGYKSFDSIKDELVRGQARRPKTEIFSLFKTFSFAWNGQDNLSKELLSLS